MKKDAVLIINIENNQEAYACCLNIIKQLERFSANQSDFKQIIKQMSNDKKYNVTYSLKKLSSNPPYNYYEEPLYDRLGNIVPVLEDIKIDREKSFENYVTLKSVNYHIRVKINSENLHDNDFVNLSYLAMVLQEIYEFFSESSEIVRLNEKVSVFISGESNKEKIYQQCSSYLRQILKLHKGVIYACPYNDSNKVETLEFQSFSRNESVFPLMFFKKSKNVDNTIDYLEKTSKNRKYIRDHIDSLDNYGLLFNTRHMPNNQIIEKAFCQENNTTIPFNFANDKNPQLAFADFVLDCARERLLYEFSTDNEQGSDRNTILNSGKANILNYIWSIQKNINGFDRFTFAVFSFLLQLNDNDLFVNVEENIKYTSELSLELSSGIKQLIQNSLQHSERECAFVSFIRTDSGIVKILVSDLNTKNTIVENFLDTLKKEKENISINYNSEGAYYNTLKGYERLIELDNKISIKNLLGEFGNSDYQNAWRKFREADVSAHIGLNIFYYIFKKYNAGISVISNKSPELLLDNQYHNDYIEKQCERIIPGTQVLVSVPVEKYIKFKSNSSILKLDAQNVFDEGYEAYSSYLKYDKSLLNLCEDRMILNLLYNADFSASSKKFIAQMDLTDRLIVLFNSLKTDEYVNYIDFKQDDKIFNCLKNEDACEVFLKSFFVAINAKNLKKNVYLALVNCSKAMINVFKKLTSSSLALMDFSENLQLYISKSNDIEELCQMTFFGSKIGFAVRKSYILSLEHGEFGYSKNEYLNSVTFLEQFEQEDASDYRPCVFPFSAYKFEDETPDFFKQIKYMSELEMNNQNMIGYKYSNTHMRLGNKVHTKEFFEMSFLFYRTNVSNKVSYYILNELFEKYDLEEIIKNNQKIVFYGYASYSQAILMSLTEILKKYILIKGIGNSDYVSYATYQYNLQSESDKDSITVYRNDSGNYFKSFVVQIVPISSTLTTFNKMWVKYLEQYESESPEILSNYTIFIARDQNHKRNNCSKIEKKYWKEFNIESKTIKLKKTLFTILGNKNIVNYILSSESDWSQPIECNMCFPSNVLFELPIVETDPTSTVPSQQLHISKNKSYDSIENVERIIDLYNYVYYGHITRGKNHFQYYIDTQSYFAMSQYKIKTWLEKERNNFKKNNAKFPVLNVIFSPEHNTNVGFSQYVNTYFFNGVAEIVSVNEDKQFRSNFIKENSAVYETIIKLINDFEFDNVKPVHFYFVDDNINTGSTFRKASNLLKSLIPNRIKHLYGTNVFDKCFVLIDRMSESSKESFVANPKDDFLSYCHINISNMRTQGDSCVGCKLETEANRLFKRSSTIHFANYWFDKSENYKSISFDKVEKKYTSSEKIDSFIKLALSHVIQNKIDNLEDIQEGLFFDWIIAFSEKLYFNNSICLEESTNKLIEFLRKIICENNNEKEIGLLLFKSLIKILARPFFIYNYDVRTQVMQFLIIIAEYMFEENDVFSFSLKDRKKYNKTIEFFEKNDRITKINDFLFRFKRTLIESVNQEKITDFIINCLFRALSDIKSTYLIRENTLVNVCKYIDKLGCYAYENPLTKKAIENSVSKFLLQYAVFIHKVIDANSDETRSLWFEYLLVFGKEYNKKTFKNSTKLFNINSLYNSIMNRSKSKFFKNEYKDFCELLYIQNSGIVYDGIEKSLNTVKSQNTDFENLYFIENWKEHRIVSNHFINNCINSNFNKATNGEIELFKLLQKSSKLIENGTDGISIIEERYKNLLNSIRNAINDKYHVIKYDSIDIAILTKSKRDGTIDIIWEEFSIGMEKLEFPEKTELLFFKKSLLKDTISSVINNEKLNFKSKGYYISNIIKEENSLDYPNNPYVLMLFNNNGKTDNYKLGRTNKEIEEVYLYLTIDVECKENIPTYLWMILRDISTYRHSLLRFFEEDFNSDIMQRNFRSMQEKAILSHEKANSHSSFVEDDSCLDLFYGIERESEITDEKLMLMYYYTNVTISKIFNRSFHDPTDSAQRSHVGIPKLYLANDKGKYLKKKFIHFSDLNILDKNDKRFQWIDSALNIIYDDNLESIEIINNNGVYYNLEYIKCLFLDIFLSSMKYKDDNDFYIERFKNLICQKIFSSQDNMVSCSSNNIYIFKKISDYDFFDFLIILNPINNTFGFDYQYLNKKINMRLSDPIDFADGHMSLIAIKRYIEGIDDNLHDKSEFKYYTLDEIKSKYKDIINVNELEEELYFEISLPILKKE